MMLLDKLVEDYNIANKNNDLQKKYLIQELRMNVMIAKNKGQYPDDKNIAELLNKVKDKKVYELAIQETAASKDSKERCKNLKLDIQYIDELLKNN